MDCPKEREKFIRRMTMMTCGDHGSFSGSPTTQQPPRTNRIDSQQSLSLDICSPLCSSSTPPPLVVKTYKETNTNKNRRIDKEQSNNQRRDPRSTVLSRVDRQKTCRLMMQAEPACSFPFSSPALSDVDGSVLIRQLFEHCHVLVIHLDTNGGLESFESCIALVR